MDAFILRSIYPKLSQCLAEFIINPHQQHLGMKPQNINSPCWVSFAVHQCSIRGGSTIFLGGGALFSCSTSTPINHIVWQNTSCIRKPQVISGGGGGAHTLHPPPRSAPEYGVLLKGLCHGYLFYFVFNAIYASLFAMKLDKLPVNDKITSFVSNKVCLQSIISIVSNNNNELWKTVRLKKKPELQSVSIFFKFLHQCLLLYLPCHLYRLLLLFFELLFNVSLGLVAVSSRRILMNFVAQLMVIMILSTCSPFNPLSPNSDQQQFSPNNIHTLSRDKVMRINKMIIIRKIPWSFIKFSRLILKGDIWRSVWRICMWILGLKGLISFWYRKEKSYIHPCCARLVFRTFSLGHGVERYYNTATFRQFVGETLLFAMDSGLFFDYDAQVGQWWNIMTY